MTIKIVSLMCLMTILVSLFWKENVVTVQAEEKTDEPNNLYAQSAVLMDADSGRILFGKEADVPRPMASTTKIMTCILALEHKTEGEMVTVSEEAAAQPEVHLGVRVGEEYYIEDILYSLMLESHNDSAVLVAEGISGSVEEFTALMNEKAEELGCKDTHFVTPNGLDGEDEGGVHSTTAADLARIMRYCIIESPKREEFLAITQMKNYQFSNVAGDRSFSCDNHNAFLGMMEGALTGKTGFTADAGYCYVGALSQSGETYIVALLACGWPNNKNYKWSDTRTLMEYGLSAYDYRNVWEELPEMEVSVKGGVNERDIYQKDCVVKVGLTETVGELRILLRADENVEVQIQKQEELQAPVKKGTLIGEVVYFLEEQEVARYPLAVLETVEERDIKRCFQELLKRFFICGYSI